MKNQLEALRGREVSVRKRGVFRINATLHKLIGYESEWSVHSDMAWVEFKEREIDCIQNNTIFLK